MNRFFGWTALAVLVGGLTLLGDSLLRQQLEWEKQEAGQQLRGASRNMIEAITPARAIQEGFRPRWYQSWPRDLQVISPESASRVATFLCKSLLPLMTPRTPPQSEGGSDNPVQIDGVRLALFDRRGNRVFSHGFTGTPEEWKTLWRGQARLCFWKPDPRSQDRLREELGEATRLCRLQFGSRASLGDFPRPVPFAWRPRLPDGRTVLVACQMRNFSQHESLEDNDLSGYLLEVDLEALDKEALFQASLDRKPTELSSGFILGPNASTLAEADRVALQKVGEGKPVPTAGRYLAWFRLPDFPEHLLVLAKPASPLAIGSPLTRLLPSVLLSFGLVAAGMIWYHLAWSPRGTWSGLSLQLGGSFFLAAAGPLLFLLILGFGHLRNLPLSQRIALHERMTQLLLSIESRYREFCDTRQGKIHQEARRVARWIDDEKRLKTALEQTNEAVVGFFDLQGTPHLGSNLGEDREETRIFQTRPLRVFMRDFLQDRSRSAGQAAEPTSGPAAANLLPLEELLGGPDNPLFEILRRNGQIIRSNFFRETSLTIAQIVTSVRQAVLGMLLVKINMRQLEHRFFLGLREEPASRDFTFLQIRPGEINPPRFQVPPVTDLYSRSRESGRTVFGEILVGTETHLIAGDGSKLFTFWSPALAFPLRVLQQRIHEFSQLLLVAFAVAMTVVLGASWWLFRRLLPPIQGLRRGAEEIGQGHLRHRLPLETRDEFGLLAHAFNRMAQGLEERERMRRFLSAAAWRADEDPGSDGTKAPSGRRFPAAVLFSDLRGFTTLSERNSPQAVVSLLNEYFTAMDGCIRAQHGEIDKLIGDAIFAIFPERPDLPHPTRRAIAAGLAMRQRLADLNRTRQEQGEFPIDNGIGIEWGVVIAGRVGADQGRQDFTHLGPPVGRAAALEAASRHGTASRVVVSPAALAAAGPGILAQPLAGTDQTAWEIETAFEAGP